MDPLSLRITGFWIPGLKDFYYVRYLWLIGVMLGGFGLIIGVLKLSPLRTHPSIEKTWIAFRSWLVMAPLALLVLGLGRAASITGFTVLSLLFVKEFARATGLYRDWGFVVLIYAVVLGLFWTAWIDWYGLFVAMPVYGVFLLFLMPTFRNEYAGMIQKVGLSTIALVYLGWFPAHLAFLTNHPNWYAYLLFLIVGTELNDASAFLTGKLFGKHPLVPNVSPKKTIEGTLGSLVFVAVFVWLVRAWLPGFSPLLCVLSVLIIWIGGTMGDLAISFVKRDIGIKDMGALIPGHGGLLDRFDSLLMTGPLFFHMITHYVKFPLGTP